MLFTVAIPTFNNRSTIGGAIRSALNQTYGDDYEVLVVNNASTDGTLEEIQKFEDNKVRVVNNHQTVDMYSNHNICLEEAKGDYIVFCHSDDRLTEDALSIIQNRLEKRLYPSKYILWGHSMFRDFQVAIDLGCQKINTMFSGETSIKSFIWGGLTPSGTCYSRKSVLEIGGFPIIDAKIPMSDWAILVKAAYNYFEFEMIDRLLFIREYASTASCDDSSIWEKSIILTLDKLKEILNEQQFGHFVKIVKTNNSGLFYWYKKYMSEAELLVVHNNEIKSRRKQRIKNIMRFLLRI